jgi:hypothetical protein
MTWRDRRFSDPILYSFDQSHEFKLAATEGQAAVSPSAVLVFHGMGQQVRFETLSDLASTILDEAEARGGHVTGMRVALAPASGSPGDFLARVEAEWTDKAGASHAAHFYEAYWAPLTEGKVTYWDTIKFLLAGAWNGLRCTILSRAIFKREWSFDRWVFNDFKPMRISKWSIALLVLIVLYLLLAVAFIAFAIASAQQLISSFHAGSTIGIGPVMDAIYRQIAIGWNFIASHLPLIRLWQFPLPPHPASRLTYVFGVAAWLALIAQAFFLRYFLIEYAGDVAAYLSAYKDSKFEELRSQIRKVGLDAARLIYWGSNPPTGGGNPPIAAPIAAAIPDYQNIVFVAHSLGTVVAYDTMNAIFNIENTSQPPAGQRWAAERTRAFITFGSPLDKTAFIFRAQFNRITHEGRIREMLACAVQPLVSDYKFRYQPGPPRSGPLWINLWSVMDIVSGRLLYYDDASKAPNPESTVQNVADWKAWIPLYAHVQYWGGPLLRKTVYDQLI